MRRGLMMMIVASVLALGVLVATIAIDLSGGESRVGLGFCLAALTFLCWTYELVKLGRESGVKYATAGVVLGPDGLTSGRADLLHRGRDRVAAGSRAEWNAGRSRGGLLRQDALCNTAHA